MVDYEILADAVAYLHAAVIFVLVSGICSFLFYESRFFRAYFLYVYIPVLVVMISSQVLFLGCPLVNLENSLRAYVDPEYAPMESFITTYCERYLGVYIAPELVTVAILLLGLCTVAMIVYRIRRRMDTTSPL